MHSGLGLESLRGLAPSTISYNCMASTFLQAQRPDLAMDARRLSFIGFRV